MHALPGYADALALTVKEFAKLTGMERLMKEFYPTCHCSVQRKSLEFCDFQ